MSKRCKWITRILQEHFSQAAQVCVKILLDESVPSQCTQAHIYLIWISRPFQRWDRAGLHNGELLNRAEDLFDVFVTADKNLQYQQNLSGRKLAILVLPSNQVPLVARLVPVLQSLLKRIQPGVVMDVPLD